MAACLICRKEAAPLGSNPFFPFCSERCKLIDLGKWLGGEYRIVGKVEEQEDEEAASSEDEDDLQ